MAEIEVREAVPADLPRIAAVALATGQDEEWGGADPAYMTHLLAHGRVVVGVCGGSVAGFGATRSLDSGPGAAAVRAVLASLTPADGLARVCLPAPHPAVRPLLAAGWRVAEFDLFMATEPGLLDARRAVPCAALA